MPEYILAIDQGTTSSRAILFDTSGKVKSVAQQEFNQYFPAEGWVEHDPEEIWQTVVHCCKKVITDAGIASTEVAAIGITNQRETTIIWDRNTGAAIYPAIVWQDRRTASYCEQLKNDNKEAMVTEKTGLLIDPYFSATKVRWILDES